MTPPFSTAIGRPVAQDVDELLATLDSAADDSARIALLAAASPALLEQLDAALVYRKFNADVAATIAAERAAFDSFSSELDAAPDDASRLAIIEAAHRDPQRGAAFVAEWAWQRRATDHDWHQRYFSLLGAGAA